MNARKLGRTVVILAIALIVLSMGWWAWYYNDLIKALGPKPALAHPMRCLLWTADVCLQPQAAAKLQHLPPYNPLALWGSVVVLIVGLIAVYRSQSPDTYPQIPPTEPRLLVPMLEPFYAWSRDLSWLLVRIATGGILLAVGIDKILHQDIAVFAARSMARRGLEPSGFLAYIVYGIESFGALMIVLGLFTRFFGAAIAVEFFIITFVAQFQTGFLPYRGWGVPLMVGLLFFAIALRGGGPYSLDRAIGREL